MQEVQIGRAVDCAIRTDDAMVSRHHARLYWASGQYYVEDLGSANGVFFQEQRVSRHALNHGDAVRCGSLWLRFVDPHASQQAPVQPQPVTPQPVTPQPVTPQPVTPQPVTPQPVTPQPSPQPPPKSGDSMGANDAEEIRRLRRRIDQLQTELRLYRGGKGSEVAKKIEDLENDNAALDEQVGQLKARVSELETTLAVESGDLKVKRAAELASKTSEIVGQLNDILSNLRINVMAAEGEFEQFAHQIPRHSFEMIRDSLHKASDDVDTARQFMRALRDLAD